MARVVLSLGTNAGDRRSNMRAMEAAVEAILSAPVQWGALMETEALDVSRGQQAFLNRLVVGQWDDSPEHLLDACLRAEAALGRQRPYRGSPRCADIDILLVEGVAMNTERLTLPHHAIGVRRFVLDGLSQLVPEWMVAGGQDVRAMVAGMTPDVATQRVTVLDSQG